jgi:hypothetical protein
MIPFPDAAAVMTNGQQHPDFVAVAADASGKV